MVLLIFVFVIYAIATGNTEVSAVTCILLIVLSGVYVSVLAVELISHFGGGELHAIPVIIYFKKNAQLLSKLARMFY